MNTATRISGTTAHDVAGEFVDIGGERFYAIRNVDRMPPFLVSVVSSGNHWLFASSTGGLTAGRVSPETPLFPYVTVDKVHESGPHTGPRTLLRVEAQGQLRVWEPFNREQDGAFEISRHLYKNVAGSKLCFEEVNHELGLAFRYTWMTSDDFGFIRHCEVRNVGQAAHRVEVLDGLQNILPAGTPRFTQTNSSNLVDAYKWTEVLDGSGLALYTLYAGITDRAEPCESLKASVAYCLGLDAPKILVSSAQLDRFRRGEPLRPEHHTRGIRGAFFVAQALSLPAGAASQWQIVADVELSQAQVVALHHRLADPAALSGAIDQSIRQDGDDLARLMAACDALQCTAEEPVAIHHHANVVFNVLRGGCFPKQYEISSQDFRETVRAFNGAVYARSRAWLESLPEALELPELTASVRRIGDPQLARLSLEYLPIAFGRRHGDPSRPWNQFEIRLRDRAGRPLFWYEGNWRDIFQNWEALAFSYPEFLESMIAKFVNGSTMDGYNPYRITKAGIDWEVEEPDDPWSYIGYWGDHQIIYLLKFLELSQEFHPDRLADLLHQPLFAYANVPYRIRPLAALLDDPKHTVDYDEALAKRIDQRVADLGADGKLVLDGGGDVYQVTLLEKLLVPLLAKLGNLVVDGGIWMNTQRPEWNDANNALVGQGLSMVTLYYLRRYVRFLQALLESETAPVELSTEVGQWLRETAGALQAFRGALAHDEIPGERRLALLTALGEASSRYREIVYRNDGLSGKGHVAPELVRELLVDALAALDRSIGRGRREDGLYHAYNLLERRPGRIDTDNLYAMLEGQVAALSSGAIPPAEAVAVLESLFASDLYRPDQQSFMLYPDRRLPGFLEKNRIPAEAVAAIPLLRSLAAAGNEQIVVRDADGCYRFNSDFRNARDLDAALDRLDPRHAAEAEAAREPLRSLFEEIFDHQSFTGRSGTMFGFEGLGCIYWHMVSKLLLVAQEVYFAALDHDAAGSTTRRLGELYYRVRAGLGFNKTPAEYGAFPTDPYSHTPGHGGAAQPGMTGQVKEEVLTRFGELGVRVSGGRVRFQPALLRPQELLAEPRSFRFLDADGAWRELEVPAGGLAFTWCTVPVVYRLAAGRAPGLTLTMADGDTRHQPDATLTVEDSAALFRRTGRIRRITVDLHPHQLFAH
ncbi:MAG: hypothetical protein MUC71_02205 [Steroidobacteraceae bacterium]|nr:hypothetical protein [Steroidobacteraceae bacterium]